MPIYAYKCGSCGHAKDVLQKISDAPLTVCPACGQSAFAKQVTAAGFQLKGSGWYVTDFRGGGTSAPAKSEPEKSGDAKPATDAKSTTETKSTSESKPASDTAAAKSDGPAASASA